MRKIKIYAAIFTGAWLCASTAISAQAAQDEIIRVGLAYGNAAMAAPQLQNADGAGYEIGIMNGTTFTPVTSVTNSKITIKAQGMGLAVTDTTSGAVLYQTKDASFAISPKGTHAWFHQCKYPGYFVYTSFGGKVSVVNAVPLEDYIKGVIPYEMPASWHREALKAQAVCARSYADGQRGRHKSQGFDVCNTTHCQVYQGVNGATPNSDAAVDATRGQYLYQENQKVVGYFFSSDGGATESSVNVWGGEFAYLTGKPDPYEKTEQSSNGVWSQTRTAQEIQSKLNASGRPIGTVRSVQVTKRTDTDNVNELTITDTNGKQVKLTKDACRTVLGLNSIRYTVASGNAPIEDAYYAVGNRNTVTKLDSLQGKTVLTSDGKQIITDSSIAQRVPAEADAEVLGTSFVFSGRGWGHSVGMSQYGAKAMAEQGFSYDEILRFYFTGVTVK